MKTIIVSGFRRFGTYRSNPTETLAGRLHETSLSGYRVIPVVYDANIPKDDRGEKLLALAHQLDASGIISLGVDSQKRGLCVERIARNIILNAKYCPPELQNTRVDATRSLGEELNLHRGPWALYNFQRLCAERHIPTEISHDAGGFCCNHLAYQVLAAQKRGIVPAMPFIFIHVPCSPESIADTSTFQKEDKVALDIRVMAAGIENLATVADLD